jgi:hypothetical protein
MGVDWLNPIRYNAFPIALGQVEPCKGIRGRTEGAGVEKKLPRKQLSSRRNINIHPVSVKWQRNLEYHALLSSIGSTAKVA